MNSGIHLVPTTFLSLLSRLIHRSTTDLRHKYFLVMITVKNLKPVRHLTITSIFAVNQLQSRLKISKTYVLETHWMFSVYGAVRTIAS